MHARVGLLAPLLLLAAAAVSAQQVDVAASPELRCLTLAEGEYAAPDYPFDAFKNRERGAVQVLLEFHAADAPPRATVLEKTGSEFADAVLAHVRGLRVPCLTPGSPPARLLRDYVFRPDDRRVLWHRTTDANAAADREALKCIEHIQGSDRPEYPRSARRDQRQGRVVAEVRYLAPDQPPVVVVHARRAAADLSRAVQIWLLGNRMPCHPGRPVTAYQTFEFLLDGMGQYGFKAVSLRSLLALTTGIERQRLDFDTTTMGCPFDVHLWYRQPHLPNRVGEVGERQAARRPLLEWMETVELKLPDDTLDSIYGDRALITVPCVRIDLKPKE